MPQDTVALGVLEEQALCGTPPGAIQVSSHPRAGSAAQCDSACIHAPPQWLPESTTVIETTENNCWQKSPYLGQPTSAILMAVLSPSQRDRRTP